MFGGNPAFCIGTAKSGTTTVAEIFSSVCRARHEPAIPFTLKLIELKIRGGGFLVVPALHVRHIRLRLDLESSHILNFLLPEIYRAFPHAKFILTIRDVHSWLDSEINQGLKWKRDATWKRIADLRFKKPDHPFTVYDEKLKQLGHYPLSAYISHWAALNSNALNLIPQENLLVVRSFEISDKIQEMADFIGKPLPAAAKGVYANKNTHKVLDTYKELDPAYIRELVEEYGADLMNRFFPESKFPPIVPTP